MIEETIDDVPEEVIQQVRVFLGEKGYNFFKEIYEKHGELNVVWNVNGIPHSVHFIEGMQVRNFLRTQTEMSKWADDHTFDDLWEPIVLKAIEQEPQTKKVSFIQKVKNLIRGVK